MEAGKLATNYARALLEYAQEKNVLKSVTDDVTALSAVLDANVGLAELVESPGVLKAAKQAALERAFQGKIERVTLDFLKVLIDHRRQTIVRAVLRAYGDLLDKASGRFKVDIFSARELESALLESIKSAVGKKAHGEAVVRVKIKPELVGGVIVEYEGRRFDASMRRQLQIQKERLMAPDFPTTLVAD